MSSTTICSSIPLVYRYQNLRIWLSNNWFRVENENVTKNRVSVSLRFHLTSKPCKSYGARGRVYQTLSDKVHDRPRHRRTMLTQCSAENQWVTVSIDRSSVAWKYVCWYMCRWRACNMYLYSKSTVVLHEEFCFEL